jgi:homoserine dehydrogenase
MAAMIQRGKSPDNIVPVVLMTHATEEAAMTRALARIGRFEAVVQPPRMIRIETL